MYAYTHMHRHRRQPKGTSYEVGACCEYTRVYTHMQIRVHAHAHARAQAAREGHLVRGRVRGDVDGVLERDVARAEVGRVALRPVVQPQQHVLLRQVRGLHDEVAHHQPGTAAVERAAALRPRGRARGDAALAQLGVQAGQVRVQLERRALLPAALGLG